MDSGLAHSQSAGDSETWRVGIAILTVIGIPVWLNLLVGQPVDNAPKSGIVSPIPTFEYRVDPNLSAWTSLARLPGVGEQTAKRIVQYRRDEGAESVFENPTDLLSVWGIGPKKLRRMEPYLKFSGVARVSRP
jgi:hypothetical protein